MADEPTKLLLEVPIEWMTSPIQTEADRSREVFSNLAIAACNLGIATEIIPSVMYSYAAPRLPKENEICLSYHSYGDEPRVWRIKEGYLPRYYTFDRLGFSGFSELARFPERFAQAIQDFDQSRAQDIVEACRTDFLARNVSKYEQSEESDVALPEGYVFLPLQTVQDTVQPLARLQQLDVIWELARLSEASNVPLVIKRHPHSKDRNTTEALNAVVSEFASVHVVNASIHKIIPGARAVVGANSGVLFEALIHGKPVYAFGASDFAVATIEIDKLEDLKRVFSQAHDVQPDDVQRFLGWYLDQYCFHASDIAGLEARISACFEQNQAATSGEENDTRKAVKQAFAAIELQRRNLALADRALNINMVRDAYEAVASATRRHWRLLDSPPARMTRAFIRMIGQTLFQYRFLPQDLRAPQDRPDYETLHAEDSAYRQDNWLTEFLPVLAASPARTLAELGCGNGRFLSLAADVFDTVTGVDWVQTDTLPLDRGNVHFLAADFIKDPLPTADIICSAHVLEHLSQRDLLRVLARLADAGSSQFHVVACYDDGHGHVSVYDPGTWIALFRRYIPNARIHEVRARFNDSARLICIITNIDPPELSANADL